MNTILKGLRELEGVHGALISDGAGQLIAFQAVPIYDAELLGSVSRAAVRAIESVRLLQEDWEQINTQFTEGRLLIRNLGTPGSRTGTGYTLAVIADHRLNASFATITIRVAVQKLRAMIESGQPLAAMAAMQSAPVSAIGSSTLQPQDRSGGVVASQAIGAGTGGIPRAAEVASSGLSWSGFGNGSGLSSSGVAVTDANSSHFLTACTKALARSAGPMAKVFVKDAVKRVCPDRPFSRDYAAQLIAELVKGISDPLEAAQFRAAATKSA